MAVVKIILDTRVQRKDGTYPVKLTLSFHRTSYQGLGFSVKKEQWDDGHVCNHPLALVHNRFINDRLLVAQIKLNELAKSGKLPSMTHAEVRDVIFSEKEQPEEKEEKEEKQEYTIIDHFKKYISMLEKDKTKEVYYSTLKKIEIFTAGTKYGVKFEDINYTWLQDFDKFLEKTCRINTRAIHFRNIRSIFNNAINCEIIPLNLYPFRKFKIKKEATAKRSMNAEQLRSLRDYPVEPYQEKYRDLFMLTFYLIGINAVDLFHLKEIRNERIEYRRSKTGTLYSVKVYPEAMEIIKKYRGKKYLLDILDNYYNYMDFVRRWNNQLKRIGPFHREGQGGKKIITPLFPNISTYWARHTWATIAWSLLIPKDIISAALGHKIGSEVTSIYIDFNQDLVDEANRKVIDFVNGMSQR